MTGYDTWLTNEPAPACCPHCLLEFDPSDIEWREVSKPGADTWHGVAPCPSCGETLHAYDGTVPV